MMLISTMTLGGKLFRFNIQHQHFNFNLEHINITTSLHLQFYSFFSMSLLCLEVEGLR